MFGDFFYNDGWVSEKTDCEKWGGFTPLSENVTLKNFLFKNFEFLMKSKKLEGLDSFNLYQYHTLGHIVTVSCLS